MTVEQIKKDMFPYLDYNYYIWDEEAEAWTDGDTEYQLRDYTNGEFRSILVCFREDITKSYIEFYLDSYDNEWDMLDAALSDETLQELETLIGKRLMEKRHLFN